MRATTCIAADTYRGVVTASSSAACAVRTVCSVIPSGRRGSRRLSARRGDHARLLPRLILHSVSTIELLYWDGCPSHPEALRDLRAALDELGHQELEVALVEVASEDQAREYGFIGSPTLRIDGVDPVPPPGDEPPGLTCRVYRLRDGRYSPTPDPVDLRDALRRLLPTSAEEA